MDITGSKPGAASDSTDATAARHGRVHVRPSESPSYDEDGNLISDAMWTCTWDAENRLIAMQQREAGAPLAMPLLRVEFAYDSQSRRHAKRVLIRPAALAEASARPEKWLLARTTRFWYDGWNLMAETLQSPSSNSELTSASVLRTYTWGTDLSGTMQGAGGVGGLLGISLSTINSQPSTSRSYAACSDANGNVTGLINSSAGNLAARWDYDAFGNQLTDWAGEGISTTELCPFRFSSKYQDAETGWYYYGFRYYAPEMGRWVNRDPIGERGGINLYGTVRNDAVNRIDRFGLSDKAFNFGVGIRLSFGLDSRGVVFRGLDVTAGVEGRCVENAKIKLDLNGSLYTGSQGSNTAVVKSGYDLSGTISVILGTGQSKKMPIYLSNIRQESAIGNTFQDSLLYGWSFNYNGNMGATRLGIVGLRVGDFGFAMNNDTARVGDGGTDYAWTGGGVVTALLNDHSALEFAYQDYTGLGLGYTPTGMDSGPLDPVGPNGTHQQGDDLDLNRADTTLRYRDFSLGNDVTLGFSGPGWGQDAIHDFLGIPNFYHTDRRVLIQFEQRVPSKK